MIKKSVLFFLVILFTGSQVYSQNYADVEIDISKDGLVIISGSTNYEPFQTDEALHEYTSKKGENWLFNLTTKEVFEDYVFKINLPPNSQINYIKAPEGFRIENNDGRISIVGFAENQPFNIIVQYKIDYLSTFFNKDMIIFFLLGALVFMLVFSIILYVKLNGIEKRKKIDSSYSNITSENLNSYDINKFTSRQQEIIRLLEKHKQLTQKELESKMDIPKSSVSRNVKTLEIKNVVLKEKIGQTNYLSIKK